MPKYSNDAQDLIHKLLDYFKKERDNGGPLIPINAVNERVADALGIGVATVSRMVNKKAYESEEVSVGYKSRPITDIDEMTQNNIRSLIYEMYKKKEHVSLQNVLDNLKKKDIIDCSKSSLRQILKGLGFRWSKDNPKVGLMELPHVVLARFSFLGEYIRNKATQQYQVVYLDETWIFQNGSPRRSWQDGSQQSVKSIKPESVRYVIVNAGNQNGFIPGADLIFSSKTKNDDYHGEMNHDNFAQWFEEQLLKNLEEPSLIIMDNASYHSALECKIPTLSWSKGRIQEWLTEQNIAFNKEAFKKEILQIALQNKPKKTHIVDSMAAKYGHKVLRLPPYHCIFNPIENVWGIAKSYYNRHIGRDGYGREKCLAMWDEALKEITPTVWKNSIDHAERIIQGYWNREIGIERGEEEHVLIIEKGESSSSDEFE